MYLCVCDEYQLFTFKAGAEITRELLLCCISLEYISTGTEAK